MLAKTRLADKAGLHRRPLIRSVYKSLAIPLLFAGAFCAVIPFVYGSVDRTVTVSPTVPGQIPVPLLTQSTATGSVGHVRVINHEMTAGTVSIVAYDDTGLRHGPVTLDLGAGETVHFDAGDLEEGNAEKGLGAGIGTGTGAWRLELTSSLDIEVLSYARTQDGLVSGMQHVVARGSSGYRVALFQPASTVGQISRLRLINPGATAAAVTIEGIDDDGASPGGAVRLTLAARAARMLTADELERGNGDGLSGALGDGEGRWQLVVTADRPIYVMNLLASSSSGAMNNLSSGPVAAVDGDDGATTIHAVGLFPSASNTDVEGVLRIVNRTNQTGNVSIEAIDDAGTSHGPVTLRLDALEGLVINSGELEAGASEKGLARGTGAGSGDWRLRLSTSLDIAVLSYVRPLGIQDGLLSTMHDLVPRRVWGYQVTLLDPAEAPGQTARLRLINPSTTEAGITIRGVDGTGAMPGGEVQLSLAAGASRAVTVSELEGGAGTGLSGSLGDGEGQWHLGVTANRRIQVMSLLSGPSGHLANLSSAPSVTVGVLADASDGSSDTATAAEVFSRYISRRVVQSLCITCHVEGGVSGNTRLVFEPSSTPDHEALNLEAFASFLSEVEDGTSLILNKIQGVSHGGGEQVPAGSRDFTQMERFLERLDGPSTLFGQHISEPVVQSKCIDCHVEGGRSGNTRLVFVPSTTPNHETLNLQAFEDYLSEVESGASTILSKIQGVSHGGGPQVRRGSADFAQMERFLGRLDADVVPEAITVDTLFESVRMAPLRKTLRRAALIFAGRIPTEAEYASVYGGATALRRTIRNLMTGPAFHDFLIRGANDRLLTDRRAGQIIDGNIGFLVDFTNEHYARRKTAYETKDYEPLWRWQAKTQHGFRRAPVELIAHVVENDRPYTEILTANYIMANPFAAKAYGASTIFKDSEDWLEFKPSKISKYYRQGEGFEDEYDNDIQANRVIKPGTLRTTYPHSGVLNTTSFLIRYPTTATNRNRARARWTYYHFLGVDIENSASRTMDPVALADTNNPTMHNPACTVCHTFMDPVAGAFQDYGDAGLYKDQWGGMDSLHQIYKEEAGTPFNVEETSWHNRETLSWPLSLASGTQTMKVTYTNHFWDEAVQEGGRMYLDRLDLFDDQGRRVTSVEFEDVDVPVAPWGDCGMPQSSSGSGSRDYLELWSGYEECALRIDFETATAGAYTAEVKAWSDGYDERYGDDGYARLGVTVNAYEEGDTWYRDMRTPGFGAELAPASRDSLQWLARKIVADPRFAEATVKFWWPAIMGSEIAEPPAEEGDADFEGQLLAANAQSAEVRQLAQGFRQGFNLKDLLVEMVLSKWFRADVLSDADPVLEVALSDAGARRLLTPGELAQKTDSLTGFEWGRHIDTGCGGNCGAFPSNLTDDFRLLYGGIDSDGITDRARNITSVMAGVAKRNAVRTGCPAVLRDFYLVPDKDRRLFREIDNNTAPEAEEIREKLVDLYDKLLGVEVTPYSPDVDTAFELFVDVTERRSKEGGNQFNPWDCQFWDDKHFFEGILDDILKEYENEWGPYYDFDGDRVDAHINSMDYSDEHYSARAWVVVLTYLLMDYRYLYL